MKLHFAYNGMLTPALVMAAMPTGAEAAYGSREQLIAWSIRALDANAVELNPEAFPDARGGKLTMGGIPLWPDDGLPESVVEFRRGQEVLARIEGLAIPAVCGVRSA